MKKLRVIYLNENPDMEYSCKRKSDRIIPLKTKSGIEFGWVNPGFNDDDEVQILIDMSMIKD